MSDLNLPTLRKVAEGAITPTRWKAHDDDQAGPGWDWFVVGPQPKRIEEMNEQTARYIATFDPPTAISLVDELKDARAELARLSKREGYAVRWANRSVDSVKEAWAETEADRNSWKARAENAEGAYDKLLSSWAESRERHLAAEARAEAAESELAATKASLAEAVEMARREEREAAAKMVEDRLGPSIAKSLACAIRVCAPQERTA